MKNKTNTNKLAKTFAALAFFFVQYSQATPPSPIPNDHFFRIILWGDFGYMSDCSPQFEYRVGQKGVEIYFDDSLVETRNDAILVFKTLKTKIEDLRKLAKCANLGDHGLFITYHGEPFTIPRNSPNCKSVSKKDQLPFQRIVDAIILLNSEFEDQRRSTKAMRSKTICGHR